MGPTGRFRVQLMNKVIRNNTTYDDYSISPVNRQNLQHVSFPLTPTTMHYVGNGKMIDSCVFSGALC